MKRGVQLVVATGPVGVPLVGVRAVGVVVGLGDPLEAHASVQDAMKMQKRCARVEFMCGPPECFVVDSITKTLETINLP